MRRSSLRIFLLSLRVVVFSTAVFDVAGKSFDSTSIKIFFQCLHFSEIIIFLNSIEVFGIRRSFGSLLALYTQSFFFFFFLAWCLGAPLSLSIDGLQSDCAIVNYLLLLTSKYSYISLLKEDKIDDKIDDVSDLHPHESLHGSDENSCEERKSSLKERGNGTSSCDATNDYGERKNILDHKDIQKEVAQNNESGIKSKNKFKNGIIKNKNPSKKMRTSGANCSDIKNAYKDSIENKNEIEDEDIMDVNDLIKEDITDLNYTEYIKIQYENTVKTNSKVNCSKEKTKNAAEEKRNDTFCMVPQYSHSLFFLLLSSAAYLLDWGETWQSWPFPSVCGAVFGSILDDLIHILDADSD